MNISAGSRFHLGIDTGGTFTDFVLALPSGMRVYKTPSTPRDPRVAMDDGLRQIAADLGCAVGSFLGDCELIILGTTVAVNALIEQKGVTTGLFCTKGQEDSLEIRLGHKEDGHRYDAAYPPAPILVPRRMSASLRGTRTSPVLRMRSSTGKRSQRGTRMGAGG